VNPRPDFSSLHVRPVLSLAHCTEPERYPFPYSSVAVAEPISVSPVQVKPALPSSIYMPLPQSSSQSAGFEGGVHVLRMMSQRTAEAVSEQKMFFDGVWKNTSSTSEKVKVAALSAGPPNPAFAAGRDEGGREEEESGEEQAPSATNASPSASPSAGARRTRIGAMVRRSLRTARNSVDA